MTTVKVKTKVTRGGIPSIIKNVEANSKMLAYTTARDIATTARRRVHSSTHPFPGTTYIYTDKLKRSIQSRKVSDGHFKISVGAYYGAYEEYGTRHRPGHPFLGPAVREEALLFRINARRVFHLQ